MSKRSKPVRAKKKPDPLIGTWVNGDEYETNVEYTLFKRNGRFVVRATDRYDGEKGVVRDVTYAKKESTLSFTVYWNSTGRLLKLRVRALAISPNRISYTYTYTENQMWFRKGTAPVARKKHP